MRRNITRFNVVLLIVMLTCSCCTDDEQPGYDQAINPLWEFDFGVGPTIGIVPIVYQDRVILSSASEGRPDLSDNDKLIALDKKEGSLLWEWSDHIESRYENFDANSLKPIYMDVMALSIGSRNFAVNLLTGHTVWKNRNNASTSRSSLSNLGPKLFRTDIANNLHNERIMEGNFQTGTWKPIYEVDGGDSIRQGLQVPSFYFEPDGDTIMVFTNTLLKNYRDVIPHLISYNKTKKKEYYTVLLQDKTNGFTAVDWFPIIDGERVYIAVDDMLVCHNVLTGERIWKCQLNANLLFSGFILVNGRIYANSEGYGYLWCIDASTGNVIWKKETPGTSSPIQYYNNTLYFVGGSDGLLHIVDAGGGETLTLITAPTQFKNSNDFFSTRCTVDPQTGKLYVVSFSTAYCYPPYR